MTQITSQEIFFFFGAGASAAFGIPTMRYMANEFRHTITNDGSKKSELYNEIVEMLKNDMDFDGY